MPSETPNDPTLTPLLKERQFLAACVVGLPGLLYAYVAMILAVLHHHVPNVVGITTALAANPITLYLLARQYPRGKSTEAVGTMMQAVPGDPYGGGELPLSAEDHAEAAALLHLDGPETEPDYPEPAGVTTVRAQIAASEQAAPLPTKPDTIGDSGPESTNVIAAGGVYLDESGKRHVLVAGEVLPQGWTPLDQ